MMFPESRDEDGLHPVTESLIKLLVWLRGPPRRSEAMLATACSAAQQEISNLVCRKRRPGPDGQLAQLIELATQGQVPAGGWLLPVEREARDRRRMHATEQGLLFSAGAASAPRCGQTHFPRIGHLAEQLGLAPAARPARGTDSRRRGRPARRGLAMPSVAETGVRGEAVSPACATAPSAPPAEPREA
jgi:hypothetical protein